MIRQGDYAAGNGESGGAGAFAGASAGAHHASHAIQPSNRPVVPIVSQPISKPIELPPQYRPRKPRKQVNVACQPCRKRRSKVNFIIQYHPTTLTIGGAMEVAELRRQPRLTCSYSAQARRHALAVKQKAMNVSLTDAKTHKNATGSFEMLKRPCPRCFAC
jgi:hypothetical protein